MSTTCLHVCVLQVMWTLRSLSKRSCRWWSCIATKVPHYSCGSFWIVQACCDDPSRLGDGRESRPTRWSRGILRRSSFAASQERNLRQLLLKLLLLLNLLLQLRVLAQKNSLALGREKTITKYVIEVQGRWGATGLHRRRSRDR